MSSSPTLAKMKRAARASLPAHIPISLLLIHLSTLNMSAVLRTQTLHKTLRATPTVARAASSVSINV